MIERLRNRRCWGETLPPSGDRCHGERRIRLIESIERQEWAVRDAEISQIQVFRLVMCVESRAGGLSKKPFLRYDLVLS